MNWDEYAMEIANLLNPPPATNTMKTIEQLEHENKSLRQLFDLALNELGEWRKLQMWGETPEQVHDFIRSRIIKGQKRTRELQARIARYKSKPVSATGGC